MGMARRFFLLLCVLFCFTSCGISKTNSHFSYGDRSVAAYFPKKVAIQLCETDPTVLLEITGALTEGLSIAGIEVVNPGNSNDMADTCRGGTLPQAMRKDLRDTLGVQGLFVGVFAQRRVEPTLLTRFELKLIGNPSGELIWITNVKMDHLAAFAHTRTIAAKAAEIAVESFKQDLFDKSKQTEPAKAKKSARKDEGAGRVQGE
jgi:hypothetical protein